MPDKNRLRPLFVLGLGLLSLTTLLAWSASGFQTLDGWFSYFGVLLLAAGMFWLGWWAIRGEPPPRWLLALLLVAALLRLALGVFWTFALPLWGYDTEVQQAGYIMEDAYNRDAIAWRLAESGEPLSPQLLPPL